MKAFAAQSNPSWVEQLDADKDQEKHAPNNESRRVISGHYVLVEPTPLAAPILVHHSKELAQELGLSEEATKSSAFVRFFSGDMSAVPEMKVSWATPYALSIYGQPMYANCPYGDGTGYGDGRAISVAEVLLPSGRRYELQLKGAGNTPFSRGADGRAVLRSSVREFLASEFMHHCGVGTTRALSLVASETDTVMRPWYSQKAREVKIPEVDNVPVQFRKMLVAQYLERFKQPDVMRPEICAITCRVAPSFLRVGHIELFSRRVQGSRAFPAGSEEHNLAKEQLKKLVDHAIFREFPDIPGTIQQREGTQDLKYLAFLERSSRGIARLTADWIRVGYCQGNFNSDNCLVAGRTMDYGPFGFIEKFSPLWNMWLGGGEHFGFFNQGEAGARNFETLVDAVLPLFESSKRKDEARELVHKHQLRVEAEIDQVWKAKLGLDEWRQSYKTSLVKPLFVLMQEHPTDYTMFFRLLADVVEIAENEEANLFQPLSRCFWHKPPEDLEERWTDWLRSWLAALTSPAEAVVKKIKSVSPKYVPREYMLVEAYSLAIDEGDYSGVHELLDVFRRPFDEQPKHEAKYFQKAPIEVFEGIGVGGVSHMT